MSLAPYTIGKARNVKVDHRVACSVWIHHSKKDVGQGHIKPVGELSRKVDYVAMVVVGNLCQLFRPFATHNTGLIH